MNEFLGAQHHWVTLDTPEPGAGALCGGGCARPARHGGRGVPRCCCSAARSSRTPRWRFRASVRTRSLAATRGTATPPCGKNTAFPWAQSTAYRASFIKDGVLGGIDPAAFVDARYKQTLAETSVLPGRDALETRMRQMVNLNFYLVHADTAGPQGPHEHVFGP